jgi:NADPH:quinone reductase-like Zn-dependent oxidoreductase
MHGATQVESYAPGAMKAAVRYRYGPPEVVEIRDVEMPVPTDDQVLVRVHTASVNRADLDGLTPRPAIVRLFMGLRAPRVPRIGLDVAGVVEAVGPAVTRFKPGDRVFGDMYSFAEGSFAEFVCTAERAFQPIPADLSFEYAAALPHSSILAVQSLRLRDERTIKPGDRVLIDGASGNVGPFAVQIAKSMGADVTGVCRTDKMEFVRSLGADRVLDYTTTDYTRSGERYDWIVDTDSHHPIRAVRRALKPNGVYVTLGGNSIPIFAALLQGALLSRSGDRWMGLLLWWKPFQSAGPDVERVLSLIANGKVKPVIDRRYPLSQVVDALRWVNDGHAKGKVLINVASAD